MLPPCRIWLDLHHKNYVKNDLVKCLLKCTAPSKKSAFSSTQTMEGIEIFLIPNFYCLGTEKLKYLQIYFTIAFLFSLFTSNICILYMYALKSVPCIFL
jgi:hypothetical protein